MDSPKPLWLGVGSSSPGPIEAPGTRGVGGYPRHAYHGAHRVRGSLGTGLGSPAASVPWTDSGSILLACAPRPSRSSGGWHTPGRSTLAGDHQGLEATFAQFGRYAGETGGTIKAALQRVLTGNDGRVIGMRHITAERNDTQLDVSCCIVFEIKDGRVTDGRKYVDDLYGWDEFWS
jgi:ketosteroid isomerase-like protein